MKYIDLRERTKEDILKIVIEKNIEIERLNAELKLYKDNQEHLNKLLQQKDNIIKEVREYIEQNEFYLDYKTGACIKGVMPLLEILDKEKDNGKR